MNEAHTYDEEKKIVEAPISSVTIGSIDPYLLIIRHPEYGVSEMISKTIDASIINAGDGSHEHPTQALLDLSLIHI